MKKSQFSGIDYAVVEKFKAPIEKFNTNQDLQDWALDRFVETSNNDYGGRKFSTKCQRQQAVFDWSIALKRKKDSTNTEKLLVLNGITKDLKPNEDKTCITLNNSTLDKTLQDLKSKLNENPKYQFDFGKIYAKNLHDLYARAMKIDENTPGWVVIPSREHNPENFRENIKILQNLSDKHWCTKHGGALLYLNDGDFHLYMEKGVPKIAIRFDEDIIKEINNDMNDKNFSPEYIKILEKYIDDNNFLISDKTDMDIKKAKMTNNYQDELVVQPQSQQVKQGFWSKLTNLFIRK